MDWSLIGISTFILLAALQAFTVGQHIHHNLPDNLEIIDPKSLGLSGADLENFLGNVKLLPIDGDQGSGGGGPKTQILTVGFDGNEKLNLDDFASLSTHGLAENDKNVAEMAFKKFQDFFKNPDSAKQFEEQQHPQTTVPSTSYSSSANNTGINKNNANSDYNSTEKPKKKRLRVHKRPIFSSTFRSNEETDETSTEPTESYNKSAYPHQHQHQDYARAIQELQTKIPTMENLKDPGMGESNQPQPQQQHNQNNQFPVYHNFPDQPKVNNYNGDKQNLASSPQVGFGTGVGQNYVNQLQNGVGIQDMTYFNQPTYQPKSQLQNPPAPKPQEQQEHPNSFSITPSPQPEIFASQQTETTRGHQQTHQLPQPLTHFQPQIPHPEPQFPPPTHSHYTDYTQPPKQQPLILGAPELKNFPSLQNEVTPYFPNVEFEPPQYLNSIQQQPNINFVNFPQALPQPQPQIQHQPQQQYSQNQNQSPQITGPPQNQQNHHPQPHQPQLQPHQPQLQPHQPQPQPHQPQLQPHQPQPQPHQPQLQLHQPQPQSHQHTVDVQHIHITPVKANFHQDQHKSKLFFPPPRQGIQENLITAPQQYNNNREQKSIFQNQNYHSQTQNQQYRPHPQQSSINPQVYTPTTAQTTTNLPAHNRFRVNANNNGQQSFNNQHQLTPTTPVPFPPTGPFDSTPKLIPIATVENAMNAYHSQLNRQRYLEKMKEHKQETKSTKPSFENNFNTFNGHSHQHEIRHPSPPNNNFQQHPKQFNGQPAQQHQSPQNGFSNNVQFVQPNRPPSVPAPPPPPPPPQSFQQQYFPPLHSHQQQPLRPFPPQRPDFVHPQQRPPQHHFLQSQETRHQVPPPQHQYNQKDTNFRGPKPFPGPFQQNNFRQSPQIKSSLPSSSNFREQRVLHRIHITHRNNTNNHLRQSLQQSGTRNSNENNFRFQGSPSTNFAHPETSRFNDKNQHFRHPPQVAVYQQPQTLFNLLRPHESKPSTQSQPKLQPKSKPQPHYHRDLVSASSEVPIYRNPVTPASPAFRFPLSSPENKNSLVTTADQHPEAAMYAKAMGLHVHSIKPSPLLTSFKL